MAEIKSGRYTFANANLDTKKLKFLSGSQTNLNQMMSRGGAVEGAFYLTTDTHRLYIGRTITKDGDTPKDLTIPIPVNEGITTVETLSALNDIDANVGEFYYISGTPENPINILAVRAKSGTGTGQDYWVQLNNDTNITLPITDIAVAEAAQQTDANNILYTLTITQRAYDNRAEDYIGNPIPYTANFSISKATIRSLINVGLQTSTSNNHVVLSTSGDGADTDNSKKVTIIGSGAVSVTESHSSTGNTITISGQNDNDNTTYTLSNAAGSVSTNTSLITLTGSDQSSSSVTLEAGTRLKINDSVANKITYYHDVPGDLETTLGQNQNAINGSSDLTGAIEVDLGQGFNIPKIDVDDLGHIRSSSGNTKIKISDDEVITGIGVDANNPGKLQITKKSANSVTSSTDVLYYQIKLDDDTNYQSINNQGQLGHFYTKNKIDSLIADAKKTMNAMTYKGTIGNNQATINNATLPSNNVSIGDTYLVSTTNPTVTITTNNGNVDATSGDLFIATGTEGGYIKSTDTTVQSNKTYYTRSGSASPYTYTKVTNPTGNPSTSNYYEETEYITEGLSWTRVESGNIDTTYSLTLNNNVVQLNPSTSQGATGVAGQIEFEGSSPIVVATSAGDDQNNPKITISHSASGATGGTYGSNNTTTLSSGGSFTVPNFTVNGTGHITSAGSTTITLPASNNDSYTFTNVNNGSHTTTFNLMSTGDANSKGSITIGAGNKIAVGVDNSNSSQINIAHQTISTTSNASTLPNTPTTMDANGITVVTGMAFDDGHVTNVTYGKYVAPDAVTYALNELGAQDYSSSLIGWRLNEQGSDTSRGTAYLESSSLTFGHVAATQADPSKFTVDIVWGAF